MTTQKKRRTPGAVASFGDQLISDLAEGIEALRAQEPLSVTLLPKLPDKYPARKIVSLRQRHRLSQSAFAVVLNVSVKAVQSWEQGKRHPNGASMRLLQILENPAIAAALVGGRSPAKQSP